MTAAEQIVGVILAGGRGSRLYPHTGGGPKPLADLGGKPLIRHIVDRLQPQVSTVIISANDAPEDLATLGAEVVRDQDGGGSGPLGGLLAAMQWAKAHRPQATALLSASVDTPFLPEDLCSRLTTASRGRAAIATSNSRRHPTTGLWPLTLASDVTTALESNQRGVNNFALRAGAIEVPFPFVQTSSFGVDPFFNVNTPEDLDLARVMLEALKHHVAR